MRGRGGLRTTRGDSHSHVLRVQERLWTCEMSVLTNVGGKLPYDDVVAKAVANYRVSNHGDGLAV